MTALASRRSEILASESRGEQPDVAWRAAADAGPLAALLPRVAAGKTKIGVGVTQPKAGFNTFAIETVAWRDGDDYVLDEAKN